MKKCYCDRCGERVKIYDLLKDRNICNFFAGDIETCKKCYKIITKKISLHRKIIAEELLPYLMDSSKIE